MCKKPEIGMQIHILDNALQRRVNGVLDVKYKKSLSGLNVWIICFIAGKTDEGIEVFQNDLEPELGVTRSAVSRCLTLLEQKGMITRVPSDEDARRKKLMLTEEGWEVAETMKEDSEATEKQLRKGFSEEELNTLLSLMERVYENIKEDPRII